MEFILPSWLSIPQFEVLKRITPGPLGQGMTQQMAADDMDVCLKTVKRIVAEIKTKFPSAWERVRSMQRVMNRQLRAAHNMRSLDGISEAIGLGGIYDETENTF